ncbi:ABC-2 family transporter protein [Nostoc sp. DSM 114160]
MKGSLSFYLRNSKGLTQQWRNAILTFSTYRATLFEGTVKLLLYTLIPAGLVTYLPIEALRSLSLIHAVLAVAGVNYCAVGWCRCVLLRFASLLFKEFDADARLRSMLVIL